jgi:tetratricopeptide (TPR) repeat protein
VIVLQNLGLSWFPQWHYAVALGYDRPADEIVMHSGEIAMRRVKWRRFYYTWNRSDCWGLLVLPPGSLPVNADETAYLKAVLGLEHAHQWEAAQQAYHAARQRWPDSLGALIGEGNSHAALGDWGAAERCFRTATLSHPQNGDSFNNLAHVLARQGRWDEARRAIAAALAAGGPNTAIYRQTLAEIQALSVAPDLRP